MGFRTDSTSVLEGWAQFLYRAYKHVIEGGPLPALFAVSRTVFLPKSSDVDNNGRIVRSPEASRPMTLCNCDCKIFVFKADMMHVVIVVEHDI